jgi:uncharacterized protein with HEPN domain
MNKLDRDRLADMLHYARTAVRLLGSADAAALEHDDRTFLSVQKAIENVGEAANQVSVEGRTAMPDFAWSDAIAMRHRLVHGYKAILPIVVVKTVRNDLPDLIKAMENVVGDEAS